MRNHRGALLDYLAQERAYYEAATAGLDPLRSRLRSEFTHRLGGEEQSIPWTCGPYSYLLRTPPGGEYPQLCRPGGDQGDLEVVLDANTLAAGHDYLRYGVCEPSPDGRYVAYSVDFAGDEVYELRFRDTASGRDLDERIPRTHYGCAWSSDSSAFFYTIHDAAHRPHRVCRHVVGTDPETDAVVFEEGDERFHVNLSASRSGSWVVISTESRDTNEQWLIPAGQPLTEPRRVEERRRGIEYFLEHRVPGGEGQEEAFVILTDDGAVDFRVVGAPVDQPGRAAWEELVAGQDGTRRYAVNVFAGHLLIGCRRDREEFLQVLRPDGTSYEVHPEAPDTTLEVDCRDPTSTALPVVATDSLISPRRWWSLEVSTGKLTLLRRQDVPGYRPEDYALELHWAPATDGVEVPVSVAFRKGLPTDGTSPCLVCGYGAYETIAGRGFSTALPSLLDRGFVYAVAHVRGGGERGRRWWLDGRLSAKHHTFTDFLAARDYLVRQRLVAPDRVVCRGLSAGGLLTGAVYTLWPELWAGVVAEAPAVDLLNQMLDPSVPLTVNEYDEWGNPSRREEFDWIRSYTPYEHVSAAPRPPLLVTGTLRDPRVLVYVPARWVAALRADNPDRNLILFRAELGPGSHRGPSGRLRLLNYEAEIYAWIIEVATRS
jgi:oligopeptidase B